MHKVMPDNIIADVNKAYKIYEQIKNSEPYVSWTEREFKDNYPQFKKEVRETFSRKRIPKRLETFCGDYDNEKFIWWSYVKIPPQNIGVNGKKTNCLLIAQKGFEGVSYVFKADDNTTIEEMAVFWGVNEVTKEGKDTLYIPCEIIYLLAYLCDIFRGRSDALKMPYTSEIDGFMKLTKNDTYNINGQHIQQPDGSKDILIDKGKHNIIFLNAKMVDIQEVFKNADAKKTMMLVLNKFLESRNYDVCTFTLDEFIGFSGYKDRQWAKGRLDKIVKALVNYQEKITTEKGTLTYNLFDSSFIPRQGEKAVYSIQSSKPFETYLRNTKFRPISYPRKILMLPNKEYDVYLALKSNNFFNYKNSKRKQECKISFILKNCSLPQYADSKEKTKRWKEKILNPLINILDNLAEQRLISYRELPEFKKCADFENYTLHYEILD